MCHKEVQMTEADMMDFVRKVFGVTPELSQDYDVPNCIHWSEEVADIDAAYDKLYQLESFFNQNGYTLMGQDDNEFFGAVLTPV